MISDCVSNIILKLVLNKSMGHFVEDDDEKTTVIRVWAKNVLLKL